MRTKNVIISILIWAVATNIVSGQQWIGEAFELDTSVALPFSTLPSDLTHLQYCISGNTLYFTEQKSFQHAENDYSAHFFAFSLEDFSSFEFDLPMPETSQRRGWLASTYWIQDFCLYENRCAVSVQDHIILYHRTAENRFEFDTLFTRRNVKALYFHQAQLYYLEEDHDFGYHWYRFNPVAGRDTLVRDLPYEAPHVVQASPNRYLFHDENNLFFLSTRSPILGKYSLDGTWLEDFKFGLPDWHPFEDDYIRKSLQVPYGVERIIATKDQIFDYSYLKAVFPIGSRYLLFYTQYDTTRKKSVPMFALADSTGACTLYHRKCPESLRYTEGRFPFNLFKPLEDLGRTGWQNCLVEISAECNLSWQDLTQEEFYKLKESYFRQHDPIVKIRIMRLKTKDFVSDAFFYDSRQELFALDRLPGGKHLIIIHHNLECSACARFLLHAMDELDSTDVHLDILYSYLPGALQERELHKDVRKYLSRPYDFYFLATDRTARYPCYISDRASHYPAVLFYEKGKAPIIFSNEQIFEDDPYTYRFRPAFQEVLDRFSAK